jgi:predicted anti-sigma-YlaC factor YlaD
MRIYTGLALFLGLSTCLAASGCSIKKFAVNKVGDALAEGGSTWESDDDIALVGEALPFSLKLVESLLAQSPEHRGLLQVACQGFTTYSYAYVQHDADVVSEVDFEVAREMRERMRRLYLRALGYGLRGLEVSNPELGDHLQTEPTSAVAVITKDKDVPLMYWTAASLGLAISVSKDSAAMLARLPEAQALVDRALELDETWGDGSLYEFRITLDGASPGLKDYERMREDYDRALELSGGSRASLFVTYAEAVAIPRQDVEAFRTMLNRALAVDPDTHVEIRLPNLIAQRRARLLLDRIDDHFLELEAS